MARLIPPERFSLLIAAATRTFIARGYRLTQMADIAEVLGVAKGTLYGYVESKEALFDAAVRHADGHATALTPSELPVRTPTQAATLTYIRERIAAEATDMTLVAVVSGKTVIKNARRELQAVLSDLYQRIARNRQALKLIDRCAADYPELAQVWFGEGRDVQHQLLAKLIETGASKKRYRRLDEPQIVARTILEMIAFWAMHRHFDASPQTVDDAAAERAVIDFIVHGLLERP